MGLFGSDDKNDMNFSQPVDPNWVHTPEGGFLPLLSMDPEDMGLVGVGGIYLIWHAGVKPEWVFAGHSPDLAAALHAAGNNNDIYYYEKNGGLFVAWALVKPPYRAGAVKYIDEKFNVQVPNPSAYDDTTKPVPVLPPVSKKKKSRGLFG